MQIIQTKMPDKTADFAVQTIGFFDGVHCGHQYLLKQVRDEAARRHMKSMAITFREHPRKVLHPESNPPLLTTLDEKLHLLEQYGIDYVALLDFTPQLSQMTARQYMEQVLITQLRGRALVIGYDHHFGQRNGDGFPQYQAYGRQLGMDVLQAQELPVSSGIHASSTVVRTALQSGDIATASRILGRPYSISGTVQHGEAIGRTIGFPTANILPDCPSKAIPMNGAYAVRATLGSRTLTGMLYIGNRPTLDNLTQQRIEVNLLDFNEDIYGQSLRLEFLAFLRSEEHFSSMESLKMQLQKDLQEVRQLTSASTDPK